MKLANKFLANIILLAFLLSPFPAQAVQASHAGETTVNTTSTNDTSVDLSQADWEQIKALLPETAASTMTLNIALVSPSNDDFDNAIVFSPMPFSDTKDISLATTAMDDPFFPGWENNPPCGWSDQDKGHRSVWYKYTASNTGLLEIDTFGSQYDTLITVWTGSRGSLSLVGCSGDSSGLQSQVNIDVINGTTYYVEVVSESEGSYGLLNIQAEFQTQGPYTACSATNILSDECDALVALYDNTDGAFWTNRSGWKQTNTPCSWYGVMCTGSNVSGVFLKGNNLAGNIPTNIEDLSQLYQLNLSNNNLIGNVPPEIGNLSNLFGIYLNGNSLNGTIPATLGDLSSLSEINLGDNDLNGSIPLEIANLSNLHYLYLYNNQLSDGIPAALGNLSNLDDLQLHGNLLTGIIPINLFNLSKLRSLSLGANHLTGELPSEIGNLAQLETLYLDTNYLRGEIPSTITNLVNLSELSLCCGLSSTDPTVIAFIDGILGSGWYDPCPEVLSIELMDPNPTSAASVDFAVTFSEAVTGVSTSAPFDDFTLTTTGLTGGSISSVSGSGDTYTVTVNTGSGDGTIRLDVNDSGTNIQDLAGNPLSWGFTSGEVYDIDKTPPGTSIDAHPADPSNDDSPTFEFSSPDATAVFECQLDSVGYSTCSSPKTYTGVSNGAHTFDVRAVDAAGNTDPSPDSYTWNIDSTPVVDSIIRADENPTAAPNVDFVVTFSTEVTGVDAADFDLTVVGVNGTSITEVDGSGDTYKVTVYTGSTGEGTIRLDLLDNDSILDGNGNPLGGTGVGNGDYTDGEVYTIESWDILPSIQVTPQWGYGSMGSYGWTIGSTVTMTVDEDGDLGNGWLYQNSQVAEQDAFIRNVGAVEFEPEWEEPFVDLLPGQTITATNGVITQTYVIETITFDYADPDTDTAGGTAPANRNATIEIRSQQGNRWIDFTTNPDGTWAVDFGTEGLDLLDLDSLKNSHVSVFDDAWNDTTAYLSLRTVEVVPKDSEVHGSPWASRRWPEGDEVTLVIDDDADPGNGVLYTETKIVEEEPTWCGYPCFDLQGIFTIEVGQYVTMSDAYVTKTVLVSPLTVTNIDAANDTISGLADPGAFVNVVVGGRWNERYRSVVAQPDGTWIADFSIEGGNGLADLAPGDNGYAVQVNSENSNDGTLEFWIIPYQITLKSQAQYDGWIRESYETSGKGGAKNNTSKTFFVGDDATNKQYRSILSFNTAGLPDEAVIAKVTLKIKKAGLVGTNPLNTHSGLFADIRKNKFGTSKKLQLSDFQARASKNKVGRFKKASSGWYKAVLGSGAYPYIKLNGTTQFRLRFAKDDNNDFGADYFKFYSGNAPTSRRPQLIVEYYVP